MKVYISLDIEGVTGVTGWDETELKDPMHKDAAAQMKNEAKLQFRQPGRRDNCKNAIQCM